MPATSVNNKSLLAFRDPAIYPATVSALILYVFPNLSIPRGDITGILPQSIDFLIRLIFIFVGVPTKPKSKIFSIFESKLLTGISNFFASIKFS